jgi:8-oxo-dGTP diphosphatase
VTSPREHAPGKDYIGVGVGAIVRDAHGRLLLARRGPAARNEVGAWEFPGGMVTFGETLVNAIQRELLEEYGIEIRITGLLGVFDHILPDEHQHWVSATYLAEHVSGEASVIEPDKCTGVGWYDLTALPQPLSRISQQNLHLYLQHRPDRGHERG